MAVQDLPAMKTDPKFIFFTDFDGTITLQDSNDEMTDNLGYGVERRRHMNIECLEGRIDFRDSFHDMLESVHTPFSKCIEYLVAHVQLDPHFKEFFEWANQNNVPVVVLSSGMEPIIRALFKSFLGNDADKIQIIANSVRAKPGKTIEDEDGWEIVFHDDSGFGHDKSLTIRPYAQLPEDQRPTLFYAGDGVSDLSAARETDLLFAKEGRDLVSYCVRENIPFTTFADWSSILQSTKDIVAGKVSVKEAARKGYEKYKADQAGAKSEPKETVK